MILTWPFLHFGPKRRQMGRKMSMFKIPFFHLLFREKFHKDIVTSRMFELAYEHSNNNNKIKRCPSPVTLLMLLPRTKIFTPPLSPLHWIWLIPSSFKIYCIIPSQKVLLWLPSFQLGCYPLSGVWVYTHHGTFHPESQFICSLAMEFEEERMALTEFYVSTVTLVSNQLSLKHSVRQ